MQNSPHFSTTEISPEMSKRLNQCFVCDQQFRSQSKLFAHQRGRHCEVLIFEIERETRKIKSMSTQWRVTDFDELFASAKTRRRRIRKVKDDISSEAECKTRIEVSPSHEKIDI